jgi:hypothetical protein
MMSSSSTTPLPALTDDILYTAAQKERILNEWRHFVSHGFRQQDFTADLYKLLHLHCDLPDCGDRSNFWQDFFNSETETLLSFIKQFSVSGKNALYNNHDWLYTAPKDLKLEMCAAMTPLSLALTPLLTGLAAQHEATLQHWQDLAEHANLPLQATTADGYRLSDNTRQLLALAAQSTPNRPIHGLQRFMFPTILKQEQSDNVQK